METSEFIATPPDWPHPHLRPRSERESKRLMLVRPDDVVFVFGSNLAGRHGGGAAAHALDHFGAVMGARIGWHGQSYAIPTVDGDIRPLPVHHIEPMVDAFLKTAAAEPAFTFYVTAIGTGIAGLTHEQMAPLFANAPSNCLLPPEWLALLGNPQTGDHR